MISNTDISCSTCQKEEKECTWVKYVIYAVFQQFKFYRNLLNFSANSQFPDFQNWQKMLIVTLPFHSVKKLHGGDKETHKYCDL